jgi:hypothetical protein
MLKGMHEEGDSRLRSKYVGFAKLTDAKRFKAHFVLFGRRMKIFMFGVFSLAPSSARVLIQYEKAFL